MSLLDWLIKAVRYQFRPRTVSMTTCYISDDEYESIKAEWLARYGKSTRSFKIKVHQ